MKLPLVAPILRSRAQQELAVGLIVVTAGIASVVATSLDDKDAADQLQQESAIKVIDADFMDRIRNKSYMKDTQRGIPQTLRLVTVDVPELRQHLTGTCSVDYRASYGDGVVDDQTLVDGRRVEQKMLAQSMYRCFKTSRVLGIEVLETSVRQLNPNNVRRNIPVLNAVDKIKHSIEERSAKTKKGTENVRNSLEEPVPAKDEDEVSAPWNQNAWPDELALRLEGRVQFGAMLKRSSWLSRVLREYVYQPTIFMSKHWYEYMLPSFLCHDPAGLDGETNTWASNMPHAVIANGGSLHRVPGSLALMKKICDDNGIPLYILHDPRRWVSTNKDLNEVVSDLRHTVKANVINSATKGSGSAFRRGYSLGKLEADTKYQFKDHYQSVKAKFTALNIELSNDWSRLTLDELEEKLLEHHAINRNGKTKVCSDALKDLAYRLVEQERTLSHSKPGSGSEMEDSEVYDHNRNGDAPTV